MATLFQKARVAALSVAHSLLDKVIDLNSVEAVKQHIRDLETSTRSIGADLASARADKTRADRAVRTLTEEVADLNGKIDALLTDDDPSNDHLANTLEAKLVGLEERQGVEGENLAAASQTVQALESTYSSLEAKHTQMVQRLRTIELKASAAKSKERAAEALQSAKDTLGSGADASIDSVTERIERQAAVADEKLKMAKADFDSAAGADEALAGVAARVAQRKARLSADKAS